MNIYTHDRIDLTAGLLANTSLLYGGNALQTVNITRNTPRNPNQAIGYLGVVDYNRGVMTSDVTLDTILVEGCTAVGTADPKLSTVNRYAGKGVDLSTEVYSLTSFTMAMAAGSPITANYGWITAGTASYLKSKAQPSPSDGTQFAVLMGDDEHGILLVATWKTGGSSPAWKSTVPIIAADGTLSTVDDSGLPAGCQSINISGNINRDQVLDVRTSRPIQFVTTYPVRITMDMEIYQLPGTTDPTVTAPKWNELQSLEIKSRDNIASAQKTYAKIIGLAKMTEGESINVGRYLSYTVNCEGTDIYFPITALDSSGNP